MSCECGVGEYVHICPYCFSGERPKTTKTDCAETGLSSNGTLFLCFLHMGVMVNQLVS